jgi:hypothetical protein
MFWITCVDARHFSTWHRRDTTQAWAFFFATFLFLQSEPGFSQARRIFMIQEFFGKLKRRK